MGDINEQSFDWPVSRDDAEKVLDYFLEQHLVNFGTYQDAMTTRSHFLYHSRISFALNSKMLSPREVVDRSESYYLDHEDSIAISQIEGFIRQILGWREYMRGIYWAKMPAYAEENYFGHKNSLPDFYWTADTQMKCLNECIGQSLKEAYAHHIQRLMVCGNFALLAGVDPDEVDAWYLGVYIDAIEWVEMPNTRGMSQYADGGLVASKPYVSSSNYINKMSNYCKECKYSHTKKTGENACPFNSLYWRFIAVNEEELSNNPRMAMMYRIWDKYDKEQQEELLEQADFYLDNINSL
jgi:deoxyribodipyrimidine photolyase-related protein